MQDDSAAPKREALDLSPEDVLHYSKPGPRYTSYPTAPVWSHDIGPQDWKKELQRGSLNETLSIYVHLPFCEKLCHFCACNRIIDPAHSQEENYLKHLAEEINLVSDSLVKRGPVVQMHWGGGTPTFLSPDQLSKLAGQISENFNFSQSAELSIEVNPVVTTFAHLERLRMLGFQRLSMGVQDFDPIVQDAINRHQSFEQTRDLIVRARELGFPSINLDLVYGLPKQRLESFQETLKKVIELRPERLAVYSFAKVPWKQPFQRRFRDEDLPEGLEKVGLYLDARQRLIDAGYEAIGMDHFALPIDSLAVAARSGRLHRNFMGYTTEPDASLIGFGVSAISSFGSLYVQNEKNLPPYYRKIRAGLLATSLGHRLSEEDLWRREVITNLMCNFEIRYLDFRKKFGIDFKKEFAAEVERLKTFEADGMIERHRSKIRVVGRGHVLIRNIAMIFDQYLPAEIEQKKFSNTI